MSEHATIAERLEAWWEDIAIFAPDEAAMLREAMDAIAALEAERDALKAESESRRNKLLALSDERRAEWIRAENAEATLAALRAKVGALYESEDGGSMDSRGYNAAIDAVLALLTERE